MKLQIFLGLCGATGKYACPWCLVHKQERTDLTKPKNYYGSKKMRRTSHTLNENSIIKTFGSKHKPLIEIDPIQVVPDELHLLLRISDILLQNLIFDSKQLDAKLEVLQETGDQLKSLQQKINEIGITFHTWSNKTGELEWTSLTGNAYNLLFKQLHDKLLFCHLQ